MKMGIVIKCWRFSLYPFLQRCITTHSCLKRKLNAIYVLVINQKLNLIANNDSIITTVEKKRIIRGKTFVVLIFIELLSLMTTSAIFPTLKQDIKARIGWNKTFPNNSV